MNKNQKIQLLDCTLRDGGYVNDWRFGYANTVSMFERLIDAGVDIIEVGFLDDRRPFDIDRTIFPDTKSADRIYGSLDKKGAMVVGMINYGTCGIENLAPCAESFLDGIRVIFKKGKMRPAMQFCAQVKALGYRVFSQLMDSEWMLHLYRLLDEHVDPRIGIGFHAHNNFQLAYANSLAFLRYTGRHDIVVDGTLYGMGKSAGNAPVELIAMTLNEQYGGKYSIDAMLEAIN